MVEVRVGVKNLGARCKAMVRLTVGGRLAVVLACSLEVTSGSKGRRSDALVDGAGLWGSQTESSP